MVVTRLAIAVVLAACSPSPRELHALVGDDPGYACTCHDGGAALVADAAVDAPPDASPDAPIDAAPDAPVDASAPLHIDLTAPWTRTVVTAGSPTGVLRGADGTAIDSEGCVFTPWEEGGSVTRACEVGGVWLTEVVTTGITGPEDAKGADLDGDGIIDVAIAADAGQRVLITFRGTTNVTITPPAGQGHGRAMQVAIANFDNDGYPDVAFGTRGGTASAPAVFGILHNPGPAHARDPAAWTYELVGVAGWAMSLKPVDMDGDGRADLVVSDRSYYKTVAGGATQYWDRNGPGEYLHLADGTWQYKHIGPPPGSCSSGYQCTNKSPGDELFLRVVSPSEIWDCASNIASQVTSRIRRLTTTDNWATYSVALLPPAANVAHCQDVLVTDLDGDGKTDVVVTGDIDDNNLPTRTTSILPGSVSAVYWMRAPLWDAHTIVVPGHGCKFDDIQRLAGGIRVITSEQAGDDCVAGTGAGGVGVALYEPVMVP